MSLRFTHRMFAFLVFAMVCVGAAFADDWPMYRFNSGRTASTPETMPRNLSLAWSRQFRPPSPAFRDKRLQFDAGYEPVVADGTLLIASSQTDSVKAYDAISGEQKWVFYTNGPVRLAPVISEKVACFGSDDGYMYCVELGTGKLRWKQQAVPSERLVLGNRRLISVWPIRGGPVVADGLLYFAAGVWPFEGVFVYAMQIETGEVLWRNDRMGYLFGQQPHNTEAIGGLAPQGYLLIEDDELIVPCSNAYPARFNRRTGELIRFELPSAGRYPGGWFASLDPDQARAMRRGLLTFDDAVNTQQHEDGIRTSRGGVAGLSREIRAGEDILKFDRDGNGLDGVNGVIHSMVVANGDLFVTTQDGVLLCFRESVSDSPAKPRHWKTTTPQFQTATPPRSFVEDLAGHTASEFGVAVVVGLSDGATVQALVENTHFHVVAVDDDSQVVDELRDRLDAAGLYGDRVTVLHRALEKLTLPPYITTLLTSERLDLDLGRHLQTLRPFGGLAAGSVSLTKQELNDLQPGRFVLVEQTTLSRPIVRRIGALPGSARYTGDFSASQDELVRFPLGVLWFDDALAHFKRSPQPVFDKGTMVSRPKNWRVPRHRGNNQLDYPLMPVVLSDIYTGRVLDPSERVDLRERLVESSPEDLEPSQYRPAGQPFSSKSTPRLLGQRINPLTGRFETRSFPKTYGCDGGVDYGLFYTLRSGTAAFYDKSLESGTVFLSGPRSGCTNSIIPSGGVLNVPYFYEGCTCSYPLPTAMSLVAMPERHEQWSSWGDAEIEPGTIQRVGVNFGAPGDRMTREGTLWLDYPSVGGPSPAIRVDVSGETTYQYRHSLWMDESDPYPWVSASIATGLESVVIRDLKPGNYQVRLYFCELEIPGRPVKTNRLQSIRLQGISISDNYHLSEQAGGPMRGSVMTVQLVRIEENLTLELSAANGKTLISGIELIRQSE